MPIENDYNFPGRPFVYVAGPYLHPDPVENTHIAIREADDLNDTEAVTCYVPHLTLLWHMVRPHTDPEYWYNYDLAILGRCDALLRLPGASSGADKEILYAKENNIPIFYSKVDLLGWAYDRSSR